MKKFKNWIADVWDDICWYVKDPLCWMMGILILCMVAMVVIVVIAIVMACNGQLESSTNSTASWLIFHNTRTIIRNTIH